MFEEKGVPTGQRTTRNSSCDEMRRILSSRLAKLSNKATPSPAECREVLNIRAHEVSSARDTYRRLARLIHPDCNPNISEAHDAFIVLQRAWNSIQAMSESQVVSGEDIRHDTAAQGGQKPQPDRTTPNYESTRAHEERLRNLRAAKDIIAVFSNVPDEMKFELVSYLRRAYLKISASPLKTPNLFADATSRLERLECITAMHRIMGEMSVKTFMDGAAYAVLHFENELASRLGTLRYQSREDQIYFWTASMSFECQRLHVVAAPNFENVTCHMEERELQIPSVHAGTIFSKLTPRIFGNQVAALINLLPSTAHPIARLTGVKVPIIITGILNTEADLQRSKISIDHTTHPDPTQLGHYIDSIMLDTYYGKKTFSVRPEQIQCVLIDAVAGGIEITLQHHPIVGQRSGDCYRYRFGARERMEPHVVFGLRGKVIFSEVHERIGQEAPTLPLG